MAIDVEIAWCAGFFDGEGYVGYQRSRPSKYGVVSPLLFSTISQKNTNVEVLEYFQSVVGFGTMYGPYTTKSPNGTLTHRFDLKYKTKEVAPLFEVIKPYLRKEKTDDFIRALESFRNHIPFITPKDIERFAKKGCPKCKAKWNGMVCLSCGHM